MVERGQFRLAQALDHGEHGGIDETDAQVGVGSHQFSRAHVVLCAQRKDVELAAVHGLEQSRKRIRSNLAGEEMIELHQHRRYDHPPLAPQPKEPHTRIVVRVVHVQGSDDRAGV